MKRILAWVLAMMMMCVFTAGVAGAAAGSPAIVDFSYEHGGYPDKYYSFAVYQDEGAIWFSGIGANGAELAIITQVDEAIFAEIAVLVEKYQLGDWNGFLETDDDVEDGTGFSLSILFDDDSEVFAGGHEMFPDNFAEANEAIMKYLLDKAAELEEAGLEEEEDVDTEGMEAY